MVEKKSKSDSVSNLITVIGNVDVEDSIRKFGIVGKACTGKLSLVRSLLRYANISSTTNGSIYDVKIEDGLRFIDSPFRLQDSTKYPLFHMPA